MIMGLMPAVSAIRSPLKGVSGLLKEDLGLI